MKQKLDKECRDRWVARAREQGRGMANAVVPKEIIDRLSMTGSGSTSYTTAIRTRCYQTHAFMEWFTHMHNDMPKGTVPWRTLGWLCSAWWAGWRACTMGYVHIEKSIVSLPNLQASRSNTLVDMADMG